MWCCPIYHWGGDELQTHHKNRVKTQELLQVSNWKLFLLKQTEYCITTSFNVSLKIESLCGTLEWSFKKVKVANSSHDFLDALIKASSIKMHQELLLQLTTYSTKNSISQREALSCKRTTTMLLLFTTDWIFFRPFSAISVIFSWRKLVSETKKHIDRWILCQSSKISVIRFFVLKIRRWLTHQKN